MKHIYNSFNNYINCRVFKWEKRAFMTESLITQLFKRAPIHGNNTGGYVDKRVGLQK